MLLRLPRRDLMLGAAAALAPASGRAAPTRLDRGRLRPTFADEFTSFSLYDGKTGRWRPVYGNGGPGSIDNRSIISHGEQQVYMDPAFAGIGGTRPLGINPFSVQDGVLRIAADRTPAAMRPLLWNQPYTSGLITSRFSFAQTYGYFEIRAKLPAGRGMWPAFWLLPQDGRWPPEIDVFDHIGREPDSIHLGTFMNGTKPDGRRGPVQLGGNRVPLGTTLSDAFHVYGMSWQADRCVYYFNDAEIFRHDTPAEMNTPMYLLANLAVGGSWGGYPEDGAVFPKYLEIDYIRAYAEA